MAFQKASFWFLFRPMQSFFTAPVNIFNYKRNLIVCSMAFAFYLFVGWTEFDASSRSFEWGE